MFERVSEQQTAAGAAGGDAQALEQLRLRIEVHDKEADSRSVLKRAVGSISSVFVGDEASVDHLREVYLQQQQNLKDGKAVDTAAIQTLIKSDREAAHLQTEVVHYGSQGLKTVGLFMRGRVGLAGTVGLYALDQIRPGDSFKDQLADATLGAAKGGLMKGAFHFMGDKPVGIAAKGVGLGVSSRVLELGLTRQTYLDKSGEFSLGKGLSETVLGTFNKTALAADVVIFGAAHGLLRGANSASLGRIDKSPMLTTMFTGTTFGMSSGATSEIMRQNAAGEQFDLGKVVKRSLIQGAIDTLAAAPGGVQADPHVQGRIRSFTRNGADNMRAQADSLRTSFLNLADSISMNDRMMPAMAGVPSGMRLDVPAPRPERASRPGRDPKLDGTIMMMDGPTSGSGASLDGLLSTPARTEASTRTPVERAVEPAAETGGERSLLGDARVEISSAIRVRTGEEKAAFESFEGRAEAAVVEGAGPRGKQELFKFLREHPELEIPIKQYEGLLFDSLTTAFKPGELTPAQMKERMDIVSLLGEFYKPDRQRIFVDTQQQYDAFQQAVRLMGGLKGEGSVAVISKQGLFEFLTRNPEIHDVVRRYGASSNDPRIVTVLDQYFGTKHIDGLRALNAWRADPTSRDAAPATDASTRGPEIVAETPRPAAERESRVVESAPVEAGGEKRVESAEPPPAGGEDAANSGLSALAKARPLSLVAEGGDRAAASEYAQVSPGAERRDAAVPPPAERRDATVEPPPAERRDATAAQPTGDNRDAPVPPPPARPVASPEAGRETVTASELAKSLSDPSASVRTKTARVLADHLTKLTDAEFLAWKQVAPDAILLASSLTRPDVASIPPAVLKRFLSKQVASPEQAPPAWAAEHVERARVVAEQRAATSDRPPRPPREKKDTIETRIDLLEKALNTFKDAPEIGRRLIELGAQDRSFLDGVIFSLGHPKFGDAYKSLLKQIVPHAESADGVKYLFQFMKGGDTEAVFDALQHVRPRPKTTVDAIEAQLKAEREAKPEKTYDEILDEVTAQKQETEGAYDPAQVVIEADARFEAQKQAQQSDLRPEAQKLFDAQEAQSGQQWQAIQRLVHDIMTGNIQAPRQPFGGGRGGPGGPGGGRGGDRGGPRGGDRGGGFGGGNR